jgi:serine/threonine-protein kinase HipA
VKFWEEDEFPQLAANEFFCLEAARHCGLEMPRYRLSHDGLALVVDRFDLRSDGRYRGFEDLCVLNGRRADEKYRGSYETQVFRRIQQFVSPEHLGEANDRLFTLMALNCGIRNGDAHLKNFGVCYDAIQGQVQLAPVYDLVTTPVYMPSDSMALTLNGSIGWPSAKELTRLGETRAGLSGSTVRAMLERVSYALAKVRPAIEAYGKEHPEFQPIGSQMLAAWALGQATSLSV